MYFLTQERSVYILLLQGPKNFFSACIKDVFTLANFSGNVHFLEDKMFRFRVHNDPKVANFYAKICENFCKHFIKRKN